MPKNLFPLDDKKSFSDQKHVGHNRWHPDIPANVTVKPGDVFRADCREWFDGAIRNDDSADDVRDAPLPGVHVLSGPFRVEGAKPGDLLMVDILDIGPCETEDPKGISGQGWGYTGIFPTENGGNQDIKNFTKGTRVFYPVFVDGGNLSFGDLHFSQGDGEITFCGAIEMGGYLVLGVDVIKDGMAKYGVGENAIFMPGTTDPQFSEWLAFSGTSVTLEDEQKYLDPFLGYQRACLHAIDFLEKFGYSRIQALMVLGTAPIEGRLSGVVDIPNACSTVYLPTSIFDIDIRPGHGKVPKVSGGMAVPKSLWKDHKSWAPHPWKK